MIKESVKKLVLGINLEEEEAKAVMKQIMSGEATEAQIGGFLASLRMKGETITEISSFAQVMRQFCKNIKPKTRGRLVDVVGTGGDLIKTFNISTISSLVVAGADITVAKHGNRSVTSKCGSADLLEKLGYNLEVKPKEVENLIEKVGIGFMFAPTFHPAMKYAVAPRKELGIRTVFNILGPLTNPANTDAMVLGVYSEKWLLPITEVLRNLQCKEAFVVHGIGGLDEISTIGKTKMMHLINGEIKTMEISPTTFGLMKTTPKMIKGLNPEENAELTYKILNNLLEPKNPRKEAILLNAAAGIKVGNKADSLSEAIPIALESITSGKAYKKLKDMIRASKGDLSKLEELEQKHA
ncbi:MAG: anthranilate phosphoribosyltransferase [Candidatus Ranarchaeia archaeon]